MAAANSHKRKSKPVFPADFKPGGITHALLKTVAMDLSMLAFNVAERTGLKDVVLCGSLTNSQFVRDTMAEWFTRKKVQIVGFSGEVRMFHLLFVIFCFFKKGPIDLLLLEIVHTSVQTCHYYRPYVYPLRVLF